ncbi:DinB family protein [Mesorhizobium sp. M0761]|uniref:DinB family protein n=1 Tax=unclassified Mesorhizobium TaxID=325217 RepID=UPI0003CF7E92|nr:MULTISPECIES: DinB family protein [unclassified Mesorhizobium]ESX47700.1 DNA damage-inducible protein DinB [Mesorhizobium sp. LSHC426A00]ESX47911.1 DNA damage-inducible protein DinB [Mesorhizobium sp. LSHC424B00]ESX60030.1 DNA damage-inducible protein DinB [Mesorhizobium sp. LSHC422A00]ESX69881.1 DNA damage-inducible protein DinB [Mesorhizobium sp. LSHC416B00]WJI64060.1 DinB family protein [Mesorhizobium sp. C416B]
MTLLEHFSRMAGNNLWSNDRLYRAVLQLKPGEFEAERTSFFPSIKATLNHILAVDHLYLDFLEEGGVGAAAHDDYVPFDDPQALFAAQVAADWRLIAFCEKLSEADVDRQVITDRREDGMIREKIGDILAHVFLHDIHHRGQVHAMLSGSSVAPPQLDEFLLDYDLKVRKEEVERLGL